MRGLCSWITGEGAAGFWLAALQGSVSRLRYRPLFSPRSNPKATLTFSLSVGCCEKLG